MAETLIQGQAGRIGSPTADGTFYTRMTRAHSTAVALVEAESFELSRAGRRFYVGQSAALTGIAPVQAMPTTAAQWVIWNTSLTKSLVFDSIGAYTTAGVAGVGSTVVAAIISLPATATTKAGITIGSSSGSTQTSVALINSGVTVTAPAAPAWRIVARDNSPDTVALNVMAFDPYVAGRLIVPPLRGLALAVIAPTGTTPLYAPMGEWVEIEADLE
jgi:hypothetical protein